MSKSSDIFSTHRHVDLSSLSLSLFSILSVCQTQSYETNVNTKCNEEDTPSTLIFCCYLAKKKFDLTNDNGSTSNFLFRLHCVQQQEKKRPTEADSQSLIIMNDTLFLVSLLFCRRFFFTMIIGQLRVNIKLLQSVCRFFCQIDHSLSLFSLSLFALSFVFFLFSSLYEHRYTT